MQYVVCYDIADDRRRDRVATALLDYGKRVQESVFVANLDEELAGRMKQAVQKLIDGGEDRVHVFVLCDGCQRRTEVYGQAAQPRDEAFYIV